MTQAAFNLIRPLLKSALRPLAVRFEDDLSDTRGSQNRLLVQLTSKLSATEYGRSLQVTADDDYSAFAARVPIVTYDDISCWIERQICEESNILTPDPVLFYEKTSGSSGEAKLIPYTAALKASFNRMFLLWLGDLLSNGPKLRTGKAFISISPAFRSAERTRRGVRVGLEDDSEYLSPLTRSLLKPYMVAHSDVRKLQNPTDFKYALSALLIAESGLEIISVWNPTFLEILLDHISENLDSLSDDLKKGVVSRGGLSFRFNPVSDDRISVLRTEPTDWAAVWPDLKLISCWRSASARQAAQRLSERFSGVFIQGKGLLATEAPLTFPLIEAEGFVPLPSEVFYEFLDDGGRLLRLDELAGGSEYEIILTQKGGLWRYKTGDLVRVTHFYRSAPCLEFSGRSDAVYDLVGEKLNERFAADCMELLAPECEFYVLLPVTPPSGTCHYLLIADRLNKPNARFEDELDHALCKSYHYRNARTLGQLNAVKTHLVPRARDIYYDYFIERGMKPGDIKHQRLARRVEDAAGLIRKMNLISLTESNQ